MHNIPSYVGVNYVTLDLLLGKELSQDFIPHGVMVETEVTPGLPSDLPAGGGLLSLGCARRLPGSGFVSYLCHTFPISCANCCVCLEVSDLHLHEDPDKALHHSGSVCSPRSDFLAEKARTSAGLSCGGHRAGAITSDVSQDPAVSGSSSTNPLPTHPHHLHSPHMTVLKPFK